jgi:hypothetical protein
MKDIIDIIDIIDNSIAIKIAFGSFVILDKIDEVDHPEVFKFAKIVANYIKMQKLISLI